MSIRQDDLIRAANLWRVGATYLRGLYTVAQATLPPTMAREFAEKAAELDLVANGLVEGAIQEAETTAAQQDAAEHSPVRVGP